MPKKRVWTKEQELEIIDLFQNKGCSINYIATKVYKCRAGSISKILKDNKIDTKKYSSGTRRFNEIVEKEIVFLYKENKYSQQQIAQRYACTADAIHNILKKYNVDIISKPKINKEQREDYFDVIDTENKAYWLGFIFADGCIYKNQLSIEIHEKDKVLLERFKTELNLNSKISIRHRKNTTTCCIRMVSAHLCNSLSQYGIIQNKTELTKHLPQISENLLPHLLRGLIDGDGWITKDKQGYYHIGFVGNYKSTCEDFKKYCNLVAKDCCKAKITHKGDKSGYVCQIQSKLGTKQLATVLYKDSSIYLSRKYRLVEPLFDLKNDEDIV